MAKRLVLIAMVIVTTTAAKAEVPAYDQGLQRAAARATAGDWAGAGRVLAPGDEAYAQDFAWQLTHAYYLLRAASFDDAATRYRLAHALVPESFPARLGLADALLGAARWDEAQAVTATLVTDHPEDPAILNRHALALFWLGRLDEAAEHYERALAADPANADAQAGLGWVAQRAGETADAREHFTQALALRPKDTISRNALADLPPSKAVVARVHVGGFRTTRETSLGAPLVLSAVVAAEARIADNAFAGLTLRHIGSPTAFGSSTVTAQDELHLTAGWARAKWGIAGHFGTIGSFSQVQTYLPGTLLGVSGRYDFHVSWLGALTWSSYADLSVLQLEAGAAKALTGWLTVHAGGRLQVADSGAYPSLGGSLTLHHERLALVLSADWGDQLRPVELAISSAYNVTALRRWSAHATAQFPVGPDTLLSVAFDHEAYLSTGTTALAAASTVQRLMLGLAFSL